jgi:hypothetical protein
VTVHHIHVDPIRASDLTLGNLLAETGKVRREDGGGKEIF